MSEPSIPGIDELPVVTWELAEQRKRIPEDLQQAIGAPTLFLRVSQPLDDKQRTKHQRIVAVYDSLAIVLADWMWLRVVEQTVEGAKWEVILFTVDPGTQRRVPMTLVIGRDSSGSFNFVSLHRIDESRVRRLLREGLLVALLPS